MIQEIKKDTDWNHEIRSQLEELAEEKYRIFASKLLPGTESILGVRIPHLRKIAKEIAKGDWRSYLATATLDTFEERMIQGFVIGYASKDPGETLVLTKEFLPYIDNWSVCDGFCSTLKITKIYPEEFLSFIAPLLDSDKEYEVRFGAVMLLNYYITEESLEHTLSLLDGVVHEGYYAKMAVAWAVSMCFVHDPVRTMEYLKHNHLDSFTYQKTLQKIVESLKVPEETRQIIRRMKQEAKKS